MGRKLAKEIACKFIETSSGLDHNVDELLVGIVAQVKLNPQRIRLLTDAEKRRLNLQSSIQNHRRMHLPARRMVRQMSIFQRDGGDEASDNDDDQEGAVGGAVVGAVGGVVGGIPGRPAGGRVQQVRKANRRPLNLENILKMGESELEDEERDSDTQRFAGSGSGKRNAMSKFEMLAAGVRRSFGHGNNSDNSSQNNSHSFFNENGPSTSAAAAAAMARAQGLALAADAAGQGQDDEQYGLDGHYDDDDDVGVADDDEDDQESNANTDCNRKVVTKLTARTKIFIASVLRFKKNMTRRNSSSCSFVCHLKWRTGE